MQRIKSVEPINRKVTFQWTDYRNGGRKAESEINGAAFIRRFAHHLVPKGFRQIRLIKEAGIREVEVQFHHFGEREYALALYQDSSETLTLSINLGRDDFLLKDFGRHLPRPGLGSAALKAIESKSEQDGADQPATAPESEDKKKTKSESEGRYQ